MHQKKMLQLDWGTNWDERFPRAGSGLQHMNKLFILIVCCVFCCPAHLCIYVIEHKLSGEGGCYPIPLFYKLIFNLFIVFLFFWGWEGDLNYCFSRIRGNQNWIGEGSVASIRLVAGWVPWRCMVHTVSNFGGCWRPPLPNPCFAAHVL